MSRHPYPDDAFWPWSIEDGSQFDRANRSDARRSAQELRLQNANTATNLAVRACRRVWVDASLTLKRQALFSPVHLSYDVII